MVSMTSSSVFPARAENKSIASPFPMLRFCPTGGIAANNAADYLGLSNVVCVGGSWVAPDKLIKGGQWAEIEALAREASKLKKAA